MKFSNKCIIKYYDQEFLIHNELDLKNLFKSYEYIRYMICSDNSRFKKIVCYLILL